MFHFSSLGKKGALRPYILLGTLARLFKQLPGAIFPISWAFSNFQKAVELLKIPLHCRAIPFPRRFFQNLRGIVVKPKGNNKAALPI